MRHRVHSTARNAQPLKLRFNRKRTNQPPPGFGFASVVMAIPISNAQFFEKHFILSIVLEEKGGRRR